MTPQTQIVNELKTLVAQSCRIIGYNRVTNDTRGHVSVRIPNTDLILIKGRGADVEAMEYTTERDVITMNMKGEVLEARDGITSPAETAMHLAVLRHRPDIQSVIHAHPDWVVVLTAAGKPLVPMLNAYDGGGSARLVRRGIPIYPRSMTITNDELGEDLMKTMGEANVCLLVGHGTCVAGTSVENATSTNLSVYELARLNYLAYSIGTPMPISDNDLRPGGGQPPAGGGMGGGDGDANRPGGMSSFWRYQTKRLPEIPPEPPGYKLG
jgi:ribulose-5-phosphate 4-epimerase/fuculose-1-phosphate aldolase